jgi:hypothetical protein
MAPIKATVRGGRLVIDDPTDLPEGTEVELFPADGWDDLDDEDRRRLHEALAASENDVIGGARGIRCADSPRRRSRRRR